MKTLPKLMTYTEIEKVYGLKKNTMTKKYMIGEFIPAIKIGNRNYFNVNQLEEWIATRTIDSLN